MNTDKKISFGFSKLVKKPVLYSKPAEEKNVDLVECLEGKSIKIKDAIEIVDKPLVIPIKDNNKNLLDRIKASKAKQKEYVKKDVKQEEDKSSSELTIDELAARELINDAKLRLDNREAVNSNLVLPIKDDKISFEGEEEPRLEDYESVPISDYGMAMLRGMGWKEGMSIGKNSAKLVVPNIPHLRPKGLGLGATKIIKSDLPNKTACDKDGNALILKRGTFAKIIAGSHKGNYCEVLGLDDEAGRVIVKTALNNEILTLNEFSVIPVTKEEYSKSSKVINNSKYEEYMKRAEKKLKKLDDSSSNSKPSESDCYDYSDRNQLKKRHYGDELINGKQNDERILRKIEKRSSKQHKQHTSSYKERSNGSNSDSEYELNRKKTEMYQHRSRSHERRNQKSDMKSLKNKSHNRDYAKKHHRKIKKDKKTKSKSRRRSSSSSNSSDSDRHYDSNKR